MRNSKVLTTLGALSLAVVGAGGFAVLRNDGDRNESSTASDALSTVEVERRTLAETESAEGALDFGTVSPLTTAATGTLTTVAPDGAVLERGDDLYTVDLASTVLLYGSVPMYRPLDRDADDGQDILQLQDNLLAMGFDDDGNLQADGNYGAVTDRAVRAWQESLGVEETGTVRPDDVAFLPGPVRVVGEALPVGTPVQPGTEVLTYSATTQEVQVDLELHQADLVEVDETVQVALPDGAEIEGTVTGLTFVSPDTTGDPGDQGGGADGDDGTTLEVVVEVDDTEVAETYPAATVDVVFVHREVEDVLTVPVTALLAVAGGGFAVEVVGDSGATDLVRAEPGTYADGFVEVEGDGLDAGVEVVVPG